MEYPLKSLSKKGRLVQLKDLPYYTETFNLFPGLLMDPDSELNQICHFKITLKQSNHNHADSKP